MGMQLDAFDRDRARFVEQMREEGAAHVSDVARELRARIEQLCPVDTGRLRDSWNATEGEAPEPVEPGIDTLDGFELGDTAWISTAVPYAGFVEFGTSRMAARRFVAQALLSMGLSPVWTFHE